MLASSRKPCDVARPHGGRDRPPYNTGQTGGGTGNGRPPAPGQRGDPCVGPPSGLTCGCRFCIAARPRAQCRAGDFARREGSRRPGRVLSKLGAAPLSRLTPTAPLTGEPSGWRSPQSLPCKGLRSRAPPAAEKARRSRFDGRRAQACFSARRAMRAPQTGRWMRRKAQTEGCIAAWRRKYPAKPGRGLPRIRRGRSPR